MQAASTSPSAEQRFQRLAGFLEHDPQNLNLLADAAAAALDAALPAEAAALVARYEATGALPPALLNLKGVAALSEGRFADAAEVFEFLLPEAPTDPVLRFNLAWARAMSGDHAGADALLDEATAMARPGAALLKVQALHHLAKLDEALAFGAAAAERFPDDQALMGALSVVAVDASDLELAAVYAARGGDGVDALSTLGMVSLGAHDLGAADALFDQALANDPNSPRALMGKGMALMAAGDPAAAAGFMEKGAGAFGDHLGSWVGAAWAYFAQGDYASARRNFDTAMALDDTFAETHGGLAVLDIVAGDLDSARRRTEVALRLDRKCFSAALAKSLLFSAAGDEASAERVRELAMKTAVAPGGPTLAQAVAGFVGGPRAPGRPST